MPGLCSGEIKGDDWINVVMSIPMFEADVINNDHFVAGDR